MTTAYWCIFVMILFPYFFTGLAKYSSRYNNHDPREYLAKTTGWRKRAYYVQLNCFESTPAFAIAIVIAQLVHTRQSSVDMLALIFVLTRVCYAICYLADIAMLRSLIWMTSMACIIGLFFV